MIRVGQNKENILQYRDVELLEEHARGLRVGVLSHIVHQLNTHAKTGSLDFTIIMLAGPHARVNYEFELTTVQLEECREAEEVDGLQ